MALRPYTRGELARGPKLLMSVWSTYTGSEKYSNRKDLVLKISQQPSEANTTNGRYIFLLELMEKGINFLQAPPGCGYQTIKIDN